ncbi:MAG: M42 family peptidase [Promethearchaeota archaeon]
MPYEVNEEFLAELVTTPRATGYEFPAQREIKKYLENDVDKIYADRVGNLISVINPESSMKIMLAGHIDQIGFQISFIDKKGYIWFHPLGGFDTTTLPGKRVKVCGKDDKIYLGVIGKKAVHLMKPEERKKSPEMEKLFIDIGCKDKEEAEKKVSVGDFAVYDYGYHRLGEHNYAVAVGFDDSIGAFIVAEIMKELSKDKNFYAGVYGVSTVQEEIGFRGATVAANALKPQIGIAFDVGFAADVPAVEKKRVGDTKLGDGGIIARGPNLNPVLVERIVSLAEEKEIPFQRIAIPRGTGTDANSMQLSGAATALLSIPNRYMHTASEVICLDDVKNIVTLAVEFIRSVKEEDTFIPV